MGEMCHFQLMFLLSNIVHRIIGRQSYRKLSNDVTAITNRTYIVNRHSRLQFASSLHCLMYVMAPHAFSAILGEQSRMKIDDATRIGINKIIRYQGKKTSQYNHIYPIVLHQGKYINGICQFCLGHYRCGHAQTLCPNQSIRIRPIAYNERNLYVLPTLKIAYQVLTVCTSARYENRQSFLFHIHFLLSKKEEHLSIVPPFPCWRRERDSNPRCLSARRFSRPL